MSRLWITRTRPSAESSALKWAEAGFEPHIAPLLTVSAIEDFAPISETADLIFTSANGVRLSGLRGEGARRNQTIYAIGEATAQAAREAGFVKIVTSGGNWKTLIQTIDNERQSFVHISGLHVRGRIVDALASKGLRAERRIVYRTDPVSDWPLSPIEIRAAALYSPLAARTLAALPKRDLNHLTAYCLSPAVAQALGELRLTLDFVHIAAEPTEAALIACSGGAAG